MGATRFISHVRDEGVEVSFDLVVRDATNQYTYGGGRVKVQKVRFQQRALLEADLYAAVEKIIREGDAAFTKDRAPDGPEDVDAGRALLAYAANRNIADRPGRRDAFGSS